MTATVFVLSLENLASSLLFPDDQTAKRKSATARNFIKNATSLNAAFVASRTSVALPLATTSSPETSFPLSAWLLPSLTGYDLFESQP
jgi:hypothetical protein